MAEFNLRLTEVAENDLEDFEPEIQLQVLKALKILETAPFPRGSTVKRLQGTRYPLYRFRTGDFRAVYLIQGRVISVLFIVNRKDFDKRLRAFL